MDGESTPVLSWPAANVALIELNRPANANRIQPEDLDTLERQLDECEQDEAIHVLVLAANGTHFSAGFDLRALSASATSGERKVAENDSAFERFANRLENTRLIVVAAINGPVIGGSTDIALACDLRIGTDKAYMLMPAARFGLPLYAGALQRYVTRLGLNQAKRLVFLAQKVEAAEMLAIGFLNEVTTEAALRSRVLAVAAGIAAMPAKPLAAMKQVLNASALSTGSTQENRDALLAAFDGPAIAARIAAAQAARRSQD
jgi:enoyl-CoA hydratase/carnithine racemase